MLSSPQGRGRAMRLRNHAVKAVEGLPMARCSPHEWRTPAVADAALVCDVCECRLDLANDIAPAAQAEIVGDYRRRCGPLVGRHFEEALEAAVRAARSGSTE